MARRINDQTLAAVLFGTPFDSSSASRHPRRPSRKYRHYDTLREVSFHRKWRFLDRREEMTPSVRLHTKAVHLGYKRNRLNQNCAQSRLQIEGVKDRKDAQFYMGKRVAYVYKAQTLKKGPSGEMTKYRVMWGRIIAPHGNSGHVRAKFRKNLPPNSIGKGVRVMLYPSIV